jgi:chaperonin GroEL (HSP60 family)
MLCCSEVEMRKKDRVDDALHATRAAVEEGMLLVVVSLSLRAKSVLSAINQTMRMRRQEYKLYLAVELH